MELSVRSKFMSEEMLQKRREMIENENLHINQKITIETFKMLYKKYGEKMIEKDFACFFLDINDVSYDKLEKGKTLEALVLAYEYVSNEEFQTIRKEIIETYQLKDKDRITYAQLLEMYNRFGNKLSIQLFAEEILGMSVPDISKLRTGKIKDKPINFEAEPGQYNTFHKKDEKIPMYVLNPEYIYELRKRLVTEGGLHIGDNVSYTQIQVLNKQYCPDMPEILFAQRVIDMSVIQYNTLKRINSENPMNGLVFQYVDIPNSYINRLQSTMIEKYKLEARQLLQYEEFEKLYEEYGGTLSRKSFAVLVLDMSGESYSHFKAKINKSVSILSSKKGTNFDMLRDQIIREYGFHCRDLIEYERFKGIHQMFAPNVSEFVFAEKIFGITNVAFQAMKYRGGSACIHLKLPDADEMKKLQQKVILETGIHINDKMNYVKLQSLHKLYGGILPIRTFATKVLSLDEHSFYRIKNNEKAEALALFNLEISEAEIERIKQTIAIEKQLQQPRGLTFQEINHLHTTYGGIMPLIMFSREVLGISRQSLSLLRCERYDTAIACVRNKFSEEEVKELKKYLAMEISEDEIATQMGVTTAFLKISIRRLAEAGELKDTHMLYEKVKVLVEQEKTPEEIMEALDISAGTTQKMLSRYRKEQIQESDKIREAKKQKKVNEQKQKYRKRLKENAEEILDEYIYNKTNIETVREYIEECKRSFDEGELVKEDLDFLSECMIFVQCNCKDIEVFCRMCVKFNAYRMAGYFIMENIDNEDILPEERINLMHLQENIKIAIRKEAAIKMIREGIEATSQIAEKVGLLETDVIRIKKKLQEEKMAIIKGSGKPIQDEDLLIG